MPNSTDGTFMAYLSNLYTLQDPGQVHGPTEAFLPRGFRVHPSGTPQLPSPEAVQPADLASEGQVTEAAAGGWNLPVGALPYSLLNSTDGLEVSPQGADSVSSFNIDGYIPEPGQVHGPTEAFLTREFLVYPSDAPQLPPPDAAESADLAPDVHVTDAVAGGWNLPVGALPYSMLNSTDRAEVSHQGAYVSYPDAHTLEPGQVHDPTEASQFWEFPVHHSNAPQHPPPDVAQPVDLVPEVQVTEDAAGGGNSRCEALPFCWVCGQEFKRHQEVKRHLMDVHTLKRACSFKPCNFKWIRPDKIKAHITKAHRSELHPVDFQKMGKLCGKGLVEFVNAVNSYRSLERIDVDYSSALVIEQSQQTVATE